MLAALARRQFAMRPAAVLGASLFRPLGAFDLAQPVENGDRGENRSSATVRPLNRKRIAFRTPAALPTGSMAVPQSPEA
jgi:hypothetical protein